MPSVTHVFGATSTIVASQVNQNFDDLEAALVSLDSSNLTDDAGIRATQLADRYAVWHDAFWLVPPLQLYGTGPVLQLKREAEIDANSGIIIDSDLGASTMGTFLTQRVTFDDAQEVYLCEVEVRVGYRSANTQFQLQLNGVTVGGAAVTFANNNYYYQIRNTNPIDDPFFAVTNGDVLTFQLATPTPGTDMIRGVHVRLTYKSRVNN